MCNALFSQFSLLAMLGEPFFQMQMYIFSVKMDVYKVMLVYCHSLTTVPSSTICRNESLGTTLHLLLNTKGVGLHTFGCIFTLFFICLRRSIENCMNYTKFRLLKVSTEFEFFASEFTVSKILYRCNFVCFWRQNSNMIIFETKKSSMVCL